MSLILTPPPTVMGFFKEISLKNESTAYTGLSREDQLMSTF